MGVDFKNGGTMLRILIFVSLLTIVCLFGVYIFRYRNGPDMLSSPARVNTPEIADSKPRASRMPMSKNREPQPFDPDAFYRTIIDNNIFRPLNYKPPQRESAYRLIGTVIATDGRTAAAYIRERQSEHLHVVKVGDPLGESTVQNITSKQVTLTVEYLQCFLKNICFMKVFYHNPPDFTAFFHQTPDTKAPMKKWG